MSVSPEPFAVIWSFAALPYTVWPLAVPATHMVGAPLTGSVAGNWKSSLVKAEIVSLRKTKVSWLVNARYTSLPTCVIAAWMSLNDVNAKPFS